MTPKDIAKLMDKKYNVSVGYKEAWSVREITGEQIFENIEESYDLVPFER